MAFSSGFEPDFQDFTYLSGNLRCNIKFSKFVPRFKKAQQWLEKTIVDKMTPFMPYKTGALVNRTVQENASNYGDGWVKTYGLPYGKKLYGGINPRTGKPWNWTNPLTKPYWGEYVVQQYKYELIGGVKEIIARGERK